MATAVGFSHPGGPEVLEVVRVECPLPGPTDVQIKVDVASINPVDLGFRAGRHHRSLGGRRPPFIPGMDASGVVELVGSEIDDLSPGMKVAAVVVPHVEPLGAYSSRIVVPRTQVVQVPDQHSPQPAATLPMNGLTALLVLDWLDLPSGEVLGVTGAGGVVGSLVVQMAVRRGLKVIAEAGSVHHGWIAALGAVPITRGGDSLLRMRDEAGHGVDGLVDAANLGRECLQALRPGGRIAHLRRDEYLTERGIESRFLSVLSYVGQQQKLQALFEQWQRGWLQPPPTRLVELAEVGEAHRLMERGGVPVRLQLQFGEA